MARTIDLLMQRQGKAQQGPRQPATMPQSGIAAARAHPGNQAPSERGTTSANFIPAPPSTPERKNMKAEKAPLIAAIARKTSSEGPRGVHAGTSAWPEDSHGYEQSLAHASFPNPAPEEDASFASESTPTASPSSFNNGEYGVQRSPTWTSGDSSASSSTDTEDDMEQQGKEDSASTETPRTSPRTSISTSHKWSSATSARVRTPSPESIYEWRPSVPPPPPVYHRTSETETAAAGDLVPPPPPSVHHRMSETETAAAENPVPPPPPPYRRGSEIEAAADTEPGDAGAPLCAISKGSLGHPYSCADPCKYAHKRRGCKDGEACDHCHLCNWKDLSRQRVISRGSVGHPRRCAQPCENIKKAHGCKDMEQCECCHLCVAGGLARLRRPRRFPQRAARQTGRRGGAGGEAAGFGAAWAHELGPPHRGSLGDNGRGGAGSSIGSAYGGAFMPMYYVPMAP